MFVLINLLKLHQLGMDFFATKNPTCCDLSEEVTIDNVVVVLLFLFATIKRNHVSHQKKAVSHCMILFGLIRIPVLNKKCYLYIHVHV